MAKLQTFVYLLYLLKEFYLLDFLLYIVSVKPVDYNEMVNVEQMQSIVHYHKGLYIFLQDLTITSMAVHGLI